jgi:hypothetical protein
MPYYPPEDFVIAIWNSVNLRKMKALHDTRHGFIIEFRIRQEIRIGDWYAISAICEDSVKSGYFSLVIQNRDSIKQ